MKIVLLQDVSNLGKKGEIKEVSQGYARNFLFSKGLAEMATPTAIRLVELKNEKEKAQRIAEEKKAMEMLGKLKNKEILIVAKEKKGKLFGSISSKQIALELKKDNLEISEKCIIIKPSIKKIGEYKAKIILSEKIETEIRITVKGE